MERGTSVADDPGVRLSRQAPARAVRALPRAGDGESLMDEDALIAQYVEENPRRPGPLHARLKESGVEIWALISYLHKAMQGDRAATARDYDIPLEAVEAADAYYRRNQALIDAR